MVFSGTVAFVPDAPGADVLVATAVTEQGHPVAGAFALGEGRTGIDVGPVTRYDATRTLGHVTFASARGRLLEVDPELGGGRLVSGAGADRR